MTVLQVALYSFGCIEIHLCCFKIPATLVSVLGLTGERLLKCIHYIYVQNTAFINKALTLINPFPVQNCKMMDGSIVLEQAGDLYSWLV